MKSHSNNVQTHPPIGFSLKRSAGNQAFGEKCNPFVLPVNHAFSLAICAPRIISGALNYWQRRQVIRPLTFYRQYYNAHEDGKLIRSRSREVVFNVCVALTVKIALPEHHILLRGAFRYECSNFLTKTRVCMCARVCVHYWAHRKLSFSTLHFPRVILEFPSSQSFEPPIVNSKLTDIFYIRSNCYELMRKFNDKTMPTK
jgi:hypothetical protein